MKKDNITVPALPMFRTQWDSGDPAIGCPVIGVSLTVPDESYTIRDILTRFTRMPDVVNNDLVYDFEDETGLSDFDMDQDVITSFGDLTDFDMMTDRVKILKEQVDLNDKKMKNEIAERKKRDEEAQAPKSTTGSDKVPLV